MEQGTGRISPTGTSFIIGAGHRRLLVAAEHVVVGPELKVFYVSPQGSTAWPKQYWRLTASSVPSPEASIVWAAAPISDVTDEATSTAIPLSTVLPFFPFDEGASLVAVGYPASMAKLRDAQQTLSSQLMSVVCNCSPTSVYDALGLDARVHFAMA